MSKLEQLIKENTVLHSENARLYAECQVLKHYLEETIWMARRYAHNRSTFAPSTINQVIDGARKLGVRVEKDTFITFEPAGVQRSSPKMYADDGILGSWNSEKQKFEDEK
ncbi:MAG: hypothetical protein QXL01_04395 [Thermoplasmatales archaeon]